MHANLQATEAVLEDISRKGITTIYNLGDFVDYGANPNEVIDCVKGMAVLNLQGNHDEYHVQGSLPPPPPGTDYATDVRGSFAWTESVLTPDRREFLASLLPDMYIERKVTPRWKRGGKKLVYLVHGSPEDPLCGYMVPKMNAEDAVMGGSWDKKLQRFFDLYTHHADVIVSGHSHCPFIRKLPDGHLVINVGSVGQPRDEIELACYCITDFTRNGTQLVRLEYDIPAAQQAIRDAGLPEMNALRLAEGR